MKKQNVNKLAFNKAIIAELNKDQMLKVNGGTLETSGYCCFTTKQLELDNA